MSELHEISLRERIRLNLVSSMEAANINQVQLVAGHGKRQTQSRLEERKSRPLALSHFSGFQHKEIVTGALVLPAVIWLFFYPAVADFPQLSRTVAAEVCIVSGSSSPLTGRTSNLDIRIWGHLCTSISRRCEAVLFHSFHLLSSFSSVISSSASRSTCSAFLG